MDALIPTCREDPHPEDKLTRHWCSGKPVLCERHWRARCRELIVRALEIGPPDVTADGDWLGKAEALADRLLAEEKP